MIESQAFELTTESELTDTQRQFLARLAERCIPTIRVRTRYCRLRKEKNRWHKHRSRGLCCEKLGSPCRTLSVNWWEGTPAKESYGKLEIQA
jgi:hypothetical protein